MKPSSSVRVRGLCARTNWHFRRGACGPKLTGQSLLPDAHVLLEVEGDADAVHTHIQGAQSRRQHAVLACAPSHPAVTIALPLVSGLTS